MTTLVTRRTAATKHRCQCGALIATGDVHLELVTFGPFGPQRVRECARCAHDADRDHELGVVPWEQAARQGLL